MFSNNLKRFMLRQDCTVQPLDEAWGYDLFLHLAKWAPRPWGSSFYHWCQNSNMPLRCDYIKKINDYYPDRDGKVARASLHFKYDKPFCFHCGVIMPVKWARLFQLFFLGERIRVSKPLFSRTETGRF